MKTYKLRKSDYTDFQGLMRRVGAVSNDNTQAYPQHVYCNRKDLTKSVKLLKQLAKKANPHYSSKQADMAARMYFLNLSPNELMGNPLKDGYVLVDEKAIENEKENG